jgi:hypothetical protein
MYAEPVEIRYCLTETQIRDIINQTLESHWILWPCNPRYIAQERFLEICDKMCCDSG